MEANTVLNAKDGFELDEVDKAIFANHATQLAGHFLVDAAGIVRWSHIEARDGPESLCTFSRPRRRSSPRLGASHADLNGIGEDGFNI